MGKTTDRPIRVGLISLGCAKNLVDAEIMLGRLARDGLEITNDAALADVMIVNTCSFIDAAQEESVDTILESAQVRETQNRGQGLIVAGCLPQRYREELPRLMPEVDAFMGIDQVTQVTQIVRQALARRAERLRQPNSSRPKGKARLTPPPAPVPDDHTPPRVGTRDKPPTGAHAGAESLPAPLVQVNSRPVYVPDYATPRFRLTPPHFAYLKIGEGCNHPCSFCIIPRIRGPYRSRAQDDIVQEARQLIAAGVKELNLISQDTTFYGLDRRPNRLGSIAAPDRFGAAARALPNGSSTLCTLLRELDALPGAFWIRLLYTHPAHWTEELIRTFSECSKVARYVDIPLQHIHPLMLERMRRETTQQYIIDLLARIRARLPNLVLRTTFIVGFPGETDACFQALLDFIRSARFERLGVFTYSHEAGTRAAIMAQQIPDRVKKKRRDLAMDAQLPVARQVAASFVGRTIRVLVEKMASEREMRQAQVHSWEHGLVRGPERRPEPLRGSFMVARGEGDAPDIDGRVYVRGQLPLGQFAHVKILGHTDYDLMAEPA